LYVPALVYTLVPPTNDELADHTRRRTEIVSSSFGHGAGSRSGRSSECVCSAGRN
jgi:hypothetical protein